jgi:cytochrome c-type biogenesis protein CcmF
MSAELGHFALILAFALALIQAILPLAGAALRRAAWMALVRPVARGQFLFLVLAFGVLTHAFVTNDFLVAYVAHHSSSALPAHYRISVVWDAHEGSPLLWALVLGGWTLAVTVFSRGMPKVLLARVVGSWA